MQHLILAIFFEIVHTQSHRLVYKKAKLLFSETAANDLFVFKAKIRKPLRKESSQTE
jgi:hypothetical protein